MKLSRDPTTLRPTEARLLLDVVDRKAAGKTVDVAARRVVDVLADAGFVETDRPPIAGRPEILVRSTDEGRVAASRIRKALAEARRLGLRTRSDAVAAAVAGAYVAILSNSPSAATAVDLLRANLGGSAGLDAESARDLGDLLAYLLER